MHRFLGDDRTGCDGGLGVAGWVRGVRVFKSGTRLDVQRAGKILMNLMRGAAQEARTGNIKTLSFEHHS